MKKLLSFLGVITLLISFFNISANLTVSSGSLEEDNKSKIEPYYIYNPTSKTSKVTSFTTSDVYAFGAENTKVSSNGYLIDFLNCPDNVGSNTKNTNANYVSSTNDLSFSTSGLNKSFFISFVEVTNDTTHYYIQFVDSSKYLVADSTSNTLSYTDDVTAASKFTCSMTDGKLYVTYQDADDPNPYNLTFMSEGVDDSYGVYALENKDTTKYTFDRKDFVVYKIDADYTIWNYTSCFAFYVKHLDGDISFADLQLKYSKLDKTMRKEFRESTKSIIADGRRQYEAIASDVVGNDSPYKLSSTLGITVDYGTGLRAKDSIEGLTYDGTTADDYTFTIDGTTYYSSSTVGSTHDSSLDLSLGSDSIDLSNSTNSFLYGKTISIIHYESDNTALNSDAFTLTVLPKAAQPTMTVTEIGDTYLRLSATGTNVTYFVLKDGSEMQLANKTGYFTGLAANTTYVIFAQAEYLANVQATSVTSVSPEGGDYRVTTKKGKNPSTPTSIDITSIGETTVDVNEESGVEYSLDGGSYSSSGDFSGLTESTTYTIYARYPATSDYMAGDAISKTFTTESSIERLRKAALAKLESLYSTYHVNGENYVDSIYNSFYYSISTSTSKSYLKEVVDEMEPPFIFANKKDVNIKKSRGLLEVSSSQSIENEINSYISKIGSLEYGTDDSSKASDYYDELNKIIEVYKYRDEKLKEYCDYFSSILKDYNLDDSTGLDALWANFATGYNLIINSDTKVLVDSNLVMAKGYLK
ncbi:MAG: hypothetical protein WCS51_01640 [Bacilli bacterium]